MDFASRFLGGYNQGQQDKQQADAQAKQAKINALLGQAYADPAQRQAVLGQVAAEDANMALQADSAFAGQEDRAMKRRGNLASLYVNAPEQARPILRQRYAREFMEAGLDPNDPNFDSTAQAFAVRPEGQGPKVLAPGGLLVGADGRVIAKNEYQAPRNVQLVPVPDGKGGTILMEYDPQTRALSPLNFGGAPQGQPGAAPSSAPPVAPEAVQADMMVLSRMFGVQPSSLQRDPAKNAAVGGVANSQHITGTAGDFPVPPEQKPQFIAAARQLGYEAIDEGDHIHLELPPQRGGGGGPRLGYQPPKEAAGSVPSGYRMTADGSALEPIPGGPADKPSDAKPLPVGALKLQLDATSALSVAEGVDDLLAGFERQIESGELDLGPVKNLMYRARNASNESTPQSRAYSSFESGLEKLRNDSLRLNAGVQTDGDAQRAWNELMSNINDTELVKKRLAEIRQINARGAELQREKMRQIEQNYRGTTQSAPEDDINDLLQLYGDEI